MGSAEANGCPAARTVETERLQDVRPQRPKGRPEVHEKRGHEGRRVRRLTISGFTRAVESAEVELCGAVRRIGRRLISYDATRALGSAEEKGCRVVEAVEAEGSRVSRCLWSYDRPKRRAAVQLSRISQSLTSREARRVMLSVKDEGFDAAWP